MNYPAPYARVTQWLEYCLHMAGVAGSNPATRTKIFTKRKNLLEGRLNCRRKNFV